MTPIDYYQQLVKQDIIVEDQQQLALLEQLLPTFKALRAESRARARFYNVLRKNKSVQGLYIWGGVGIGKTFVMDCFFNALPFTQKLRVHFHQFMRDVHLALTKEQGHKNPLQVVAKQLAERAIVICFDELIVTDIADAMILRRLFQALIKYGVCLVITSNSAPDDLYKKGLQRISFLPAIALIKAHTKVLHVATVVDYRLKHLQQAGVYHVPHDDIAEDDMQKCFDLLTEGAEVSREPILLNDRHIKIRCAAKDCIWFDFRTLCSPPRSQHDYLALAKDYQTIFISHIPIIREEQNDIILLFIRMIDVFYDAKIRLVVSAEAAPLSLYTHGQMLDAYQRTQSRLMEMQSPHYFLR